MKEPSAIDNQSRIDEEIRHHLEEAERNKLLNAQLLHQQAQAEAEGQPSTMSQFHKELQEKLDQTQTAQEGAEKSKLLTLI